MCVSRHISAPCVDGLAVHGLYAQAPATSTPCPQLGLSIDDDGAEEDDLPPLEADAGGQDEGSRMEVGGGCCPCLCLLKSCL